MIAVGLLGKARLSRARQPSIRAFHSVRSRGLALAPGFDQLFEHPAAIADDGQVDMDGLVDRAAIDIDVDLGRIGREGIEPAGDAVVEPRAEADDQVRPVHRHVGFIGAVHAEHAEPVRVIGGEGAEAHQRRGQRRAGERLELAQKLGRARAPS